MASAVEKLLAFTAPHLKTAGRALRAAGCNIMAYDPPPPAPVGQSVALNGASPTIAAGAFVAPTATIVGPVTVEAGGAVLYGATVQAAATSPLTIAGSVGANAVVRGAVGAGAVVEANAVVLGSVLERGVVESAAIVGAGATVAPGATVGAAELWAGAPAEKVRVLTPAELSAAAADAALAAETASLHAAECVKDFATIRAELAAREDAEMRHPRYFQPSDHPDEMTQVGGQQTGVVPGRILNSELKHADGAAPHGDATRN